MLRVTYFVAWVFFLPGHLLALQFQPSQRMPTPTAAPTDVVATIGTKKITLAEVDKQLIQQILDLEEKAYQLRRNTLEGLVNRYLVERDAAEKGQTVEEYLKAAAIPKPVEESEIEALVKQQREQRPQALEFEVRTQVRTHLEQVAKQNAFETMLRNVRKGSPAQILLPHPSVDLTQVVTEKDAFRGSAQAPIQIVEFSDFECPYCRQVQPHLKELSKRHGNNIRHIYKHFTASSHQHAKKAAEASLCAKQQGKFWEYHDLAFAENDLTVGTLKLYAKRLGLDEPEFGRCLDSGKMASQIEEDRKAGERAAVRGTPTIFINGQVFRGSAPLDELEIAIQAAMTTRQREDPKTMKETGK